MAGEKFPITSLSQKSLSITLQWPKILDLSSIIDKLSQNYSAGNNLLPFHNETVI